MNIWLPGILVFLILVPILYDEVDDIIDEIQDIVTWEENDITETKQQNYDTEVIGLSVVSTCKGQPHPTDSKQQCGYQAEQPIKSEKKKKPIGLVGKYANTNKTTQSQQSSTPNTKSRTISNEEVVTEKIDGKKQHPKKPMNAQGQTEKKGKGKNANEYPSAESNQSKTDRNYQNNQKYKQHAHFKSRQNSKKDQRRMETKQGKHHYSSNEKQKENRTWGKENQKNYNKEYEKRHNKYPAFTKNRGEEASRTEEKLEKESNKFHQSNKHKKSYNQYYHNKEHANKQNKKKYFS